MEVTAAFIETILNSVFTKIIKKWISRKSIVKCPSFHAMYCRQSWSLPAPLIYYITKNSKNPNVYRKLIKICKYFFIKNPMFVIRFASYFSKTKKEWNFLFHEKHNFLKNASCKLWITHSLGVRNFNSTEQNLIASDIIPKIYKSDIDQLSLSNQNIFLNDLIFLTSKCECIWFDKITVINEDDTSVELEKIIEILPKIKVFCYTLKKDSGNIITPKTVHNLLDIPNFLTLCCFTLIDIPETFDINQFYAYIKKNTKTKIHLKFCSKMSGEYLTRLQEIKKEILISENHEYSVPYLCFRGMDVNSSKELWKLYDRR